VKPQYSIRDLFCLVSCSALATPLWIAALKGGAQFDLICFVLTLTAGTVTGFALGSLFRKKEALAGVGLLASTWLYIILLVVSVVI
jgi:hypothetical protein